MEQLLSFLREYFWFTEGTLLAIAGLFEIASENKHTKAVIAFVWNHTTAPFLFRHYVGEWYTKDKDLRESLWFVVRNNLGVPASYLNRWYDRENLILRDIKIVPMTFKEMKAKKLELKGVEKQKAKAERFFRRRLDVVRVFYTDAPTSYKEYL